MTDEIDDDVEDPVATTCWPRKRPPTAAGPGTSGRSAG